MTVPTSAGRSPSVTVTASPTPVSSQQPSQAGELLTAVKTLSRNGQLSAVERRIVASVLLLVKGMRTVVLRKVGFMATTRAVVLPSERKGRPACIRQIAYSQCSRYHNRSAHVSLSEQRVLLVDSWSNRAVLLRF